MKDEIIRLNELRLQQAELNNRKKYAYEQYLSENEELFSKIQEKDYDIAELTENIKLMALNKFKETGEKKLDFGVGIQVRKVLEYDDKEALKWAKDHGLALSLNKTAFKKFANADPMDFVNIKENVIATLPAKFKLDGDL